MLVVFTFTTGCHILFVYHVLRRQDTSGFIVLDRRLLSKFIPPDALKCHSFKGTIIFYCYLSSLCVHDMRKVRRRNYIPQHKVLNKGILLFGEMQKHLYEIFQTD